MSRGNYRIQIDWEVFFSFLSLAIMVCMLLLIPATADMSNIYEDQLIADITCDGDSESCKVTVFGQKHILLATRKTADRLNEGDVCNLHITKPFILFGDRTLQSAICDENPND